MAGVHVSRFEVLISDEKDDETAINVPLTVTVAVIGGYIFLGALLYKYWEDWDMLEVVTSCFRYVIVLLHQLTKIPKMCLSKF